MQLTRRWKIAQYFERKWWQRYLRKKDVAAYLQWKRNYWQGVHDFVAQHIPFEKVHTILDIGCGPAGIFMLYDQQYQCTAIDPLLQHYQADLPHFKPSMYTNTTFITQSMEELNIKAQFDVVYCLNAINHVQDIEVSYSNLAQAVKPGGYVIVSIDAHNYSLLKKIFQKIPGDILHPHQYSHSDYVQLASNVNLQLVASQRLKQQFIFSYYIQVFRLNA